MIIKTAAYFLADSIVRKRTWSLTPSRWAVYRLRYKRRHSPGVVTMSGDPIEYVDSASCFSAWSAIFEEHAYRFPAPDHAPLILDLGANIGVAVRYFKAKYPEADVIAYEADPGISEVLRRNCEHLPGVVVHGLAVGGEAGQAVFSISGDDAGRLDNPETAATGGRATVEVVSLASILDSVDREVDLLKIDIEGAEVEAVLGAIDQLGRVRRMFIEYHSEVDSPQRLHELLAVLAEAGFRYCLQDDGRVDSPLMGFPVTHGYDCRTRLYALRDGQE